MEPTALLLLERRYGNPVINSVLVLLQYTSRFYSILRLTSATQLCLRQRRTVGTEGRAGWWHDGHHGGGRAADGGGWRLAALHPVGVPRLGLVPDQL